MNDRMPLAKALRLAAEDLDAQWPPPASALRLHEAVRRARASSAVPSAPPPQHPATPSPRSALRRPVWRGGLAAGLAAVLVGSVLLVLRTGLPEPPLPGAMAGGFVPLVPPERWPREADAAWLIDAELPGERLAALGLPADPSRAGRSVRAEMLVHPSGELLAVRFVH